MGKELNYFTKLIDSGDYHKETLDNRQYIVSDFTALVEGVFKEGYVPAYELAVSVPTWNGNPLFNSHPDSYNSNTPEIWEEYKTGNIFNVYFDKEEQALKGEGWFDIEKSNSLNEDILDRVKSDKPLPVSVGFYSNFVYHTGTYGDDKVYNGVHRDIEGDHLAILLDEEPACSVKQGCGFSEDGDKVMIQGANNMDGNLYKLSKKLQRSTARTPKYSGTEKTEWGTVGKNLGDFINGYYNNTGTDKPDEVPSSTEDLTSEMKSWIAKRTLLGDSGGDTFDEIAYFPVVNPSTDKLNYNGLLAARRASGRVSDDIQRSLMNKTAQLLDDEFDEDVEEESLDKEEVYGVLQKIRNLIGLGEDMNKKEKLKQSLKTCEYCSVSEDKLDNIDENYIEIMGAMLETNKQLIEKSESENSFSKDEKNVLNLIDNSDIEIETAYGMLEQSIGQREDQKQELLSKIDDNGLNKGEFESVSIEELEKVVEGFDTSSNFSGKHSQKTHKSDNENRKDKKKSYAEHINSKGE